VCVSFWKKLSALAGKRPFRSIAGARIFSCCGWRFAYNVQTSIFAGAGWRGGRITKVLFSGIWRAYDRSPCIPTKIC